ncbi:MAG: sigma-70 family RNA polymerase sigma factor [Ignavibacteriales bacterium]|nr:sigma-70 family RNA polymerase sigma factor [Ignavibacteriales bacterium]
MTEEELIKLSQSGDRKALSELVKKYEKTVYNFAFKICRDKERAEHTMQETFLSMVKSIGQFEGKSKLSTWLYTVITNHCLMAARTGKKHEWNSLDDEIDIFEEKNISSWNVDPEKVFEDNELKEQLDKAISKLPTDYRIVFLLRDVEGLSTAETGEIANLSVPAVKSRLHRARIFLREELNKVLQYEA